MAKAKYRPEQIVLMFREAPIGFCFSHASRFCLGAKGHLCLLNNVRLPHQQSPCQAFSFPGL
jgi:hypothetical protein